jgi:hypothetical protein
MFKLLGSLCMPNPDSQCMLASHSTRRLQELTHNTRRLQERTHNTRRLQERTHNTRRHQERLNNTHNLRPNMLRPRPNTLRPRLNMLNLGILLPATAALLLQETLSELLSQSTFLVRRFEAILKSSIMYDRIPFKQVISSMFICFTIMADMKCACLTNSFLVARSGPNHTVKV